jgi:hypothetical protein
MRETDRIALQTESVLLNNRLLLLRLLALRDRTRELTAHSAALAEDLKKSFNHRGLAQPPLARDQLNRKGPRLVWANPMWLGPKALANAEDAGG